MIYRLVGCSYGEFLPSKIFSKGKNQCFALVKIYCFTVLIILYFVGDVFLQPQAVYLLAYQTLLNLMIDPSLQSIVSSPQHYISHCKL